MRLAHRLKAMIRIGGKARRNKADLTRHLARRPALGLAVAGFETAVLVSNRVDLRVKYLASVRVSSLIGCPF